MVRARKDFVNRGRVVIGAILLWMSADPLSAQPDPCLTWRRTLDERRLGVLEMADWLRKQVEPEGPAKVDCLSRFLLDPMLARNGWERVAAARALQHFGLHRLESALRSPIKEIRDAAAVAVFGRIANRFVPAALTPQVSREAFEAHGRSPTGSVAEFLGGLRSKDPNERTFCLAVLRAHRPTGEARDVRRRTRRLLEALGDKDPVIRWGAALGLRAQNHAGLRGEVFDGLSAAMEDSDPDVRRAAVEAMARVAIGDARMTERVAAGLEDEDDAMVAATAESLEWIGRSASAAMDALCEAASARKGPPYLRAALLRAIVSLHQGEAEAFHLVRAALRDPAPFVRRTAVRTIPHFPGASRSAVPEMLACSRDPIPSIRSAAVYGLGRIGVWTPAVGTAVSGALNDPSPLVRIAAVSALRAGSPPDSEWAARCAARGLEDSDARVRAGAARALERVGRAAAPLVPALIAQLEDQLVQGAARKVIAGLGADAVAPLVDALASTAGANRFDLIDILGSLGTPALPSLRALLPDGRPDLREAAISALGRMGSVARPAEADLLQIVRDAGDGPLHPFAAWTLYRLNIDGPPTSELCEAAIENRWSAWAAAQAVRHRGATSPEATAVLAEHLDHDDSAISELAADALALSGVSAPAKSAQLDEKSLIERLKSADRGARREVVRRSLGSSEGISIDLDAVISRGFGVEVRTTFTERRWVRLPEIAGTGRPLAKEAVEAAKRRLLYALAAYPAGMVRARLRKVVLLRDLRVYGTRYGGTYHGQSVYLVAGERPDLDVVRAFHHEFSSLLMKSAPFPEKAWREINGAGHRYGQGGHYAILCGRTGVGTADLFELGFFKPYGLADLENDFNVFSETVMTYPDWARALAERYPRLRRKWAVWSEFLKRIDPTFVPPVTLPRSE
jgi:HEAT repeat protein